MIMENSNEIILIIISAIGGGATALIAYINLKKYLASKSKKTFYLFISMQNNELDPNEYEIIHNSINKALNTIEGLSKNIKAYWYNRPYPSLYKLKRNDINVTKYLEEIDKCDVFIAVVSAKIHSSIYFEAGYALAKRKKCHFFVPSDKDTLPSIMEGATEIFNNGKKILFSDMKILEDKLYQLAARIIKNNV